MLVSEIAESLTSVPKNLEERVLDVRDLIQMEAKDIRAQTPINWMPYLQAGLISQDDYVFINAFQYAENKDERDKLLNHFKAVQTILEKYVEKLSSFDEYKLEVQSGRLEWSVVHTRKTFWVENAHRLCENDHELLRILVLLLLENDQDKAVLCVAAHDLGEFMKHFGRGKKEVIQLGGKDALLRLLKHPNSNVKYHALKSLQILMLSSHDLLSESVSDVRMLDQADSYLKRNNAHKALFGM